MIKSILLFYSKYNKTIVSTYKHNSTYNDTRVSAYKNSYCTFNARRHFFTAGAGHPACLLLVGAAMLGLCFLYTVVQ